MKLFQLAILLISTQAIKVGDFIDNPNEEEEDTKGGFTDEEMVDRIRVDAGDIKTLSEANSHGVFSAELSAILPQD
tara:strand:- start:234 stop:461 length:228 start_codon:yes stop_codon:yes gene_type:complete